MAISYAWARGMEVRLCYASMSITLDNGREAFSQQDQRGKDSN